MRQVAWMAAWLSLACVLSSHAEDRSVGPAGGQSPETDERPARGRSPSAAPHSNRPAGGRSPSADETEIRPAGGRSPSAAETPSAEEPRAAGVKVLIYELDQSFASLPEPAPGAPPTEVRVWPALQGLQAADFGDRSENFYVEVRGFLNVKTAGSYELSLGSDDGSRLELDGRVVIDNDGLHAMTPAHTRVELTAGEHPLRIVYFQMGGGLGLELRWRMTGAANEPEAIAGSALSHTPGDIRTAPGPKPMIPALRRGRPGDGAPTAGVHPAFELRANPKFEGIATVDQRSGNSKQFLPFPHVALGRRLPCGNSTAAALPAGAFGPGQQVAWDVGLGELFRVQWDDRSKRPQGAALRFSGGLPDAVTAVRGGGDGAIYLFGQGMAAPIAALAPRADAPTVFEMRSLRAFRNGLQIEFSKPLLENIGWETDAYQIEQWPLRDSSGGFATPRRDGVVYAVKSASVSEDRRTVSLEVDGLKPEHVVYLRLLPPCVSEQSELPWSTEAWYTLIEAAGELPAPRPRPAQPPQNLLSAAEQADGWELLFDGQTTKGWRGFGQTEMPRGADGTPGWDVIDGCLVRVGPGGDIITENIYENFELQIEWRVSAAGNSGIFYGVSAEPPNRWVWDTGPEMQVLDNAEHADGRSPLTSAGANYALYPPARDTTRPVGLFNQARIVVRGDQVEHWLNGEKILAYEWGGADWKQRVAGSKFKSMPRYGSVRDGHIALQDHGDRVWYRNLKIRRLTP